MADEGGAGAGAEDEGGVLPFSSDLAAFLFRPLSSISKSCTLRNFQADERARVTHIVAVATAAS